MLHILSDTVFLNLTKLSELVLVYPHTNTVTLATNKDSNKQHGVNICHQIKILHIIAAGGKVALRF